MCLREEVSQKLKDSANLAHFYGYQRQGLPSGWSLATLEVSDSGCQLRVEGVKRGSLENPFLLSPNWPLQLGSSGTSFSQTKRARCAKHAALVSLGKKKEALEDSKARTKSDGLQSKSKAAASRAAAHRQA
ncbi:hypothetical protein SRHO_G00228350 [Serrasalmus rhombeus]